MRPFRLLWPLFRPVFSRGSGLPTLQTLCISGRKCESLCLGGSLPRTMSSTADTCEYENYQLHDGRKMKKETALNQALSQLESAGYFDQIANLSLARFFLSRPVPTISTGSMKLDIALGIGGLPKGRIIELYGQEASGKTTLALHIIKEAQKHGGCCAYFDLENAIDHSLLNTMGVDTEKLLFARPNSAENTFNVVNALVNSGAIDVIVVDSVAALVPQDELNNGFNDMSDDKYTRVITHALRKIQRSSIRSQTLIVFVNQVRSKLKLAAADVDANEATCGGNSLKFYSAIRMRITRAGLRRTEDKISGIDIRVEVVKNKLSPVMQIAELSIGFGNGINREAEVLELAFHHGLISKNGNAYQIGGRYLEQLEAERYMLKNISLMEDMVKLLRNVMFQETQHVGIFS